MELKVVLPNMNIMWMHRSVYEIADYPATPYLMPAKSEFCGTKCRNYHNGQVFWERKAL